jgi:Spy/CpxP family protein refolding chaperone
MNKKTPFTVMLLSLLLVGSAFALSQSPYKPCRLLNTLVEYKHRQHRHFKQALGLTVEQEAKIKAIRQQSKTEMAPLVKNTVEGYEVLLRYVVMPDANEEKALAMRHQLQELQEKIANIRIHTSFQIKTILTEAQREKAEELVKHKVGAIDGKREQIETFLLD